MAVYLTALTPQSLLDHFDVAVRQSGAGGTILTWKRGGNGQRYTQAPSEWAEKAWFRPAVLRDKLIFNIVSPPNGRIDPIVYSYYHGSLIETFLRHFADDIVLASASPLPMPGDSPIAV